ncbi:MAG: peroxiredoxin family protein [Pirellula staleyi]
MPDYIRRLAKFPLTVLVLLTAPLGCPSRALAQEQKTPPVQSNSQWQTLVVPDTDDVSLLVEFLDLTKKRQPITSEQYVEMQKALRATAKKLVETIKDRKSPEFRRAEAEFISASVLMLGNEGPDAQRKTFERFRDYLKTRSKIEFADIQMAVLAGQNLEQLSDYSLAKEAYKTFADVFRAKKDESLVDVIGLLEANARRLDLPGNPFRLAALTMSGEDFNIESLRGKYVLIYFWSSTTKACEQEHPYMLSVYTKYKERGFEIVGIGLDEKKDSAQLFLKKLETPWINLWDSRKNGVSKVMETFGVSAIPTSFLLDKEGKVITIEARGLLLAKALEKLLPDEKVIAP